ncbi:complex I subunit 5 family protein [Candidatus Alkanophaga liquidiphilum]
MTEPLLLFLLVPLVVTFLAPLLSPKAASYLTALAFAVPFLGTLYLLFSGGVADVTLMQLPVPIGRLFLFSDPITAVFSLSICVVSAMVALYALPYMEHRFKEMGLDARSEFRKYIFIYDLYAVSMLWLVHCGNLLLLYVFLEIMLITAFLLIFLYGYGKRQWVGLLYLIWCLIAGVLTLVGFLIIALESGTLALDELMYFHRISTLAWSFVFFGMVIELPGLGPHIWLPWAHAEAPTPVSAMLSPLTVGLAGYVLLRLSLVDPNFFATYRAPIFAYAALTSIYAGFAVFIQKDFKRLLAYSTVSQMGYILIALCVGGVFGTMGVAIQYMSHAFGKSILFMCAGGLITLYGLRDVEKMGGLHDYVPEISNAAVIGFMNLAGILTVGMLGEFFILRGAVEAFGFNLTYILPIVFIFILSGWYGFYTIRRVFYGRPKSKLESKSINGYLYVPLFIIGILSVLFLFPPLSSSLVGSLYKVVSALVGGGAL